MAHLISAALHSSSAAATAVTAMSAANEARWRLQLLRSAPCANAHPGGSDGFAQSATRAPPLRISRGAGRRATMRRHKPPPSSSSASVAACSGYGDSACVAAGSALRTRRRVGRAAAAAPRRGCPACAALLRCEPASERRALRLNACAGARFDWPGLQAHLLSFRADSSCAHRAFSPRFRPRASCLGKNARCTPCVPSCRVKSWCADRSAQRCRPFDSQTQRDRTSTAFATSVGLDSLSAGSRCGCVPWLQVCFDVQLNRL
jgi:hypothetical protein